MLMAALAPAISHALAARTPVSYVAEICSVAGDGAVKMVHEGAPDPSGPAKDALHAGDCPFCLTHAQLPALPPATSDLIAVASATFPLPSLFYQASRQLYAWAAPQSRAPPLLS